MSTKKRGKYSQLEGVSGKKEEEEKKRKAFNSKEEICHLDAAQTSTPLVKFTLKLHFSVPFV